MKLIEHIKQKLSMIHQNSHNVSNMARKEELLDVDGGGSAVAVGSTYA